MFVTLQKSWSQFKLSPKSVVIDNWVFQLHYYVTCGVLLIFSTLVTAHEYIGEKIRCTHSDPTDGSKAFDHVMETFCFFLSTYVLPRHFNKSESTEMVYPGVGPHRNEEEIVKNTYYQWVPYVVFLQAWTFCVPYLIWSNIEGGRVKALVKGFNVMKIIEDEMNRRHSTEEGHEPLKLKEIKKILTEFNDRIYIYRNWFLALVFCEGLNLANVILQMFLTDIFLGGRFWNLGTFFVKNYNDIEPRALDIAFPKMAKCKFQKYGPSGSIQTQDVICVLSLNIINEKMYLVLWFWYIILAILSFLQLLHRLLSVCLYRTNVNYNISVLRSELTIKPSKNDLETVIKTLSFREWFFLRVLGHNINGLLFRELIECMAKNINMYKYPMNLLHLNTDVIDSTSSPKKFNLDTCDWYYQPHGIPLIPENYEQPLLVTVGSKDE